MEKRAFRIWRLKQEFLCKTDEGKYAPFMTDQWIDGRLDHKREPGKPLRIEDAAQVHLFPEVRKATIVNTELYDGTYSVLKAEKTWKYGAMGRHGTFEITLEKDGLPFVVGSSMEIKGRDYVCCLGDLIEKDLLKE